VLTKRIIPCLDILNGRVVKGRKFQELRDVGDPVELAARYCEEGADELVILDISASVEGRRPFFDIVTAVARRTTIPLTVGGGIGSLDDILTLLRAGADKVSLNTILTREPSLLTRAAAIVGNQALVAAIDARRANGAWAVRVKSGTEETQLDAVQWAKTVVERGAGELLVTSIDHDGMKEGYDLELLATLNTAVTVPIIASGGAGTKEHILSALLNGKADAVLAASLFHYNELSIADLKHFLRTKGIPIRL